MSINDHMIIKVIELCLLVSILIVLVGVVIVGSQEKQLYEQCNMKILCQQNKLNPAFDKICKQNITEAINITIYKQI